MKHQHPPLLPEYVPAGVTAYRVPYQRSKKANLLRALTTQRHALAGELARLDCLLAAHLLAQKLSRDPAWTLPIRRLETRRQSAAERDTELLHLQSEIELAYLRLLPTVRELEAPEGGNGTRRRKRETEGEGRSHPR